MLAIPEPLEGTKLRIQTARVFKPLLTPARYKGAYGGRGSGKSHFFAEALASVTGAPAAHNSRGKQRDMGELEPETQVRCDRRVPPPAEAARRRRRRGELAGQPLVPRSFGLRA